jgi:hypothetical protein
MEVADGGVALVVMMGVVTGRGWLGWWFVEEGAGVEELGGGKGDG